MQRILQTFLLLAATACFAVPAQAQVAGSLRLGSEGVGVGVTTRIVPTLNGRISGSYFSYGHSGVQSFEQSEIAFEADATLLMVSALADWHPLGGALRLTGGVVYNGTEGQGILAAAEPLEVGNRTYQPEEIGTLTLDVSFGSKIAPYAGIGFGNAVSQRVGFLFDLGVIYQGSPSVDIHADGMVTPTMQEAAQIEENISWAKFYPVVSLGVSARLF